MASKPKVWCVGDCMLDVTVRGPFRTSQEDHSVRILPFPDPATAEVCPGGAANVAANLMAHGVEVDLLAPIDHGAWGRCLLERSGLEGAFNHEYGGASTGTTLKIRYYDGNRLISRLDVNHDSETGPVDPPVEDPGPLPAAVILTDYGRGAIDGMSAIRWGYWCRERSIPLFVDPKMGRHVIWHGVPIEVMVANWTEAVEAVGPPHASMESDKDADQLICAALSDYHTTWDLIQAIVVKRGQYGSICGESRMYGATNVVHIPPVAPKQVWEVQGAGDSYIAALVASHVRGHRLHHACLYASAAAGIAVGRPGTSIVSKADTLAALRNHLANPEGRLGSLSDAGIIAGYLSKFGFKIGYTNGCFDGHVLHPGHLSTIRTAAAGCDFLFVGVDSDERVRALKGSGRPVTPANDRAEAIAAVRGVHASFVFDTDQETVLTTLKPDVLFKGGDYLGKTLPETEILARWGGELVIAPTVDTPSTTERMR